MLKPLNNQRIGLTLAVALFATACSAESLPMDPGDADDGLRDAPPATLRTVSAPTLTVRVLQVKASSGGGGDAVLVADSGGIRPWYGLVDAGDGSAATYLAAAGIDTLDLMVLSHAHHDHYAGMPAVFENTHIRRFVYNGQVRSASTYEAMLADAEVSSDTVAVPDQPWILSLPGGGRVLLLPPLQTWIGVDTDDGEELNEGSLAVRLEQGEFSLLTTGDGEFLSNQHYGSQYPAWVDSDVLKVGHHGSTDATSSGWLDMVTPAVAIVSANGTTHPHGATLNLLLGRTADLYCTPQHGIVTVSVDAVGSHAVRTASDARIPCAPGISSN